MRTVEVRVDDLVRPPIIGKRLFKFRECAVGQGLPKDLVGCPYVIRGGTAGMLVNAYLRARWRHEWSTRRDRFFDSRLGSSEPIKVDPFDLIGIVTADRRPAPSSLYVTARNVDDFVSWLQATFEMDHSAEFEERLEAVRERAIEEYGDSMASGEWSHDRQELANGTIRNRKIDAIQFLRWAKAKGKAPAFVLSAIERQYAAPSYSGAKRMETRVSYPILRRADPRRIRFPDGNEVREHLHAIKDPAAQLGGLLVYGCGLRASEVVDLPANPFAGRSSASLRYLDVRGKGSKRRTIEIEPGIVKAVLSYTDSIRTVLDYRSGFKIDRLLLRSDGSAFNYRSFYRAFRSAGPISPHLGRHWYAVNFLLQARQHHGKTDVIDVELLKFDLQADLIRLQQNLGHASIETTHGYLVALGQVMRPVSLQDAWESKLGERRPQIRRPGT